MSEFLAMGGYAAYVWPTYGIAAVILVVLLVASVRGAKRAEREARALEALSPRRRRKAGGS